MSLQEPEGRAQRGEAERSSDKLEANKAVLRRWYDEMWAHCAFEKIPEIAGPTYTRHDFGGTRTVRAEEYRDQLQATVKDWKITDFHYFLMAEGDYVTAIGTWRVNASLQWDWVQTFRIADGKIVETWLPAMATDGKWSAADIPR